MAIDGKDKKMMLSVGRCSGGDVHVVSLFFKKLLDGPFATRC